MCGEIWSGEDTIFLTPKWMIHRYHFSKVTCISIICLISEMIVEVCGIGSHNQFIGSYNGQPLVKHFNGTLFHFGRAGDTSYFRKSSWFILRVDDNNWLFSGLICPDLPNSYWFIVGGE